MQQNLAKFKLQMASLEAREKHRAASVCDSVLGKRNSEECVPATQGNRDLAQRVESANADEGSLHAVAHTGNVRNELHCESGQAETLLPRYRSYESPPVEGGIQAARSQQQRYPVLLTRIFKITATLRQ